MPLGRPPLLAGPIRDSGTDSKDVPDLDRVATDVPMCPTHLEASKALKTCGPSGLIEAGNVDRYMMA